MELEGDDHPRIVNDVLIDQAVLQELEKLLGHPRLLEILQDHLHTSKEIFVRLRSLGSQPQWPAVSRLIHQIAGSNGTVGLSRLSLVAIAAEQTLADAAPEIIGGKVAQICEIAAMTYAALIEHYPELTAPCAGTEVEAP